MCGIAGYWDKTNASSAAIGATVLAMLTPMDCRGPDSAGVALYGPPAGSSLVVRVKLGERGTFQERGDQVAGAAEQFGVVRDAAVTGEYIQFVIDEDVDQTGLTAAIEALSPDFEVVSMGRRLRIAKQVGSPQQLEQDYHVSNIKGSHGIGHTRLSTESRVDLSHSQPFWAHGYPDLAVVHNGHITNYHQLRRRYQEKGVKFYTENDSEIVGLYLGNRMSRGCSLEESLHSAVKDLDGSFSCLVGTADGMGYVKDSFAHKPLLVAETDRFVAVATEEIAVRAAIPGDFDVREAQSKEVRVWQR